MDKRRGRSRQMVFVEGGNERNLQHREIRYLGERNWFSGDVREEVRWMGGGYLGR